MNNKNQKVKWETYVAEIVMASAVVIELVGKCGGKAKVKAASVETEAGEAPETE